MLRLLVIVLLFANAAANAQEKYKIEVRNDSVFNNSELQFLVNEKTSKGNSLINIKSPDNKLQAILVVVPQEKKIRFSGRFPTLNMMYDCLYPEMEMSTLYESYIRNKVFVNGVVNEKGLRDYCESRKVELRAVPRKQVARPGVGTQDSLLKARTEERMRARVDIMVSNTSKRPVTVMAGRAGESVNGKRNYSEKRQDVIPPGERRAFVAFENELICIIAGDKTEKDCRVVTHAMKSLTILPEGEGFDR
jgi:hypothetical protein